MKQLKKNQIIGIAAAAVLVVALIIIFCLNRNGKSEPLASGNPETSDSGISASGASVTGAALTAADIPEADEANATRISLKQNDTQISGEGARVREDEVQIKKAGTYILSGTLSQGKIEVDAGEEDVVVLVLDGVDVTNTSGKAFESQKAAHTSIQLKAGSENQFKSGSEADLTESTDSATAGSNTDSATADSGTASGAAISSEGDMSITGEGSLQVSGYRNDGINCKKSLCIAGGTLDITAKNDGVQADQDLMIEGGDFKVFTGEGSENATFSSNDKWRRADSGWDMSEQDEESAKAFKAGNNLSVTGGTFSVDSYDDAFHSNGTLGISGGTIEAASGDDGMHADNLLNITGGNIRLTKAYEGLEGNQIQIAGGEMDVTSLDDGVNASGETSELTISGGTITVNAEGDGLDSNGDLLIEGGTILVNGPTSSGNGALDTGAERGGKIVINGGTILALGNSGMAEGFGEDSAQCSFLHNLSSSYNKGDEIVITDADGKELFRHTAVKTGNSVVFSSSELKQGENYTLKAGEIEETIEMDSVAVSNGGSGGFGGRPGGGGRGGHIRPDGENPGNGQPDMDNPRGQRPDGANSGNGQPGMDDPKGQRPDRGNTENAQPGQL